MKYFYYQCIIVFIHFNIGYGLKDKVESNKRTTPPLLPQSTTKRGKNITNVVAMTTTLPIAISTTNRPPLLGGLRLPCACLEGQCGCCTGVILERFSQKACLNVTYEPDDFALTAAMSMNGKVLYKRTISGKNPPPMCVRIPRLPFIRFCVEFSNIYFASRNVHFCIDMEANWEGTTLLEWSFDCIRMGLGGVVVVGPEEGGGIPANPIDVVDQTDEDYDDSARNVQLQKNLIKQTTNYFNIILDKNLNQLTNKKPNLNLINVTELTNGDVFITKN